MKLSRGTSALLSLSVGAGIVLLARGAARSRRRLLPELRRLEALNDGFHEAYDESRSRAKLEAPVFIVLADKLIAHHRGERTEALLRSEAFDTLKAVSHAPVAAYAALFEEAAGHRSEASRRRLDKLQGLVSGAMAAMPGAADALDADASAASLFILEATKRVLDRALSKEGLPGTALARFARSVRGPLLQLTQHATRMQLEQLDAKVTESVARLSQSEQRLLQVVVAGDHQARARSLAMQYFQKRLGERAGEETRVAFGEGISSEAEALELIGTRRVDFAIAKALFGDARRLQRDVLGNAARDALAGRRLSRIGAAARAKRRRTR